MWKMCGYLRRKAVAPRLRWSFWDRRLRKPRGTEGGLFDSEAGVAVARMRSWMEMTLRRFLYLSMSFSKVGSRALEATYSAEVVLRRMIVAEVMVGLRVAVSLLIVAVAIVGVAEGGGVIVSLGGRL